MPVPIQQVDTDQSTTVIQALEFETPCQSGLCQQMGREPHAAAVIVLFDCGFMNNWCEDRYNRYLIYTLPMHGGCHHRMLKCGCKVSKIVRTFEIKE